MANSTFLGPVVALNGFIGGPNVNASAANDTEQGGKVAYTFATSTSVTIATGQEAGKTLSAVGNQGVMLYTTDCISSAAGYIFSDGTSWKQMNAPASDISGT